MSLNQEKQRLRMKKFVIKIRETLVKTVEVSAENSCDAMQKVIDAYKKANIILTADDYVDTDYECVAEQDGTYMVDMDLDSEEEGK